MSWIFFAILPPAIYALNGYINKFLVDRIKNPLVITMFMGLISLVLGVAILTVTGFQTLPLRSLAIILFSGLMLNFYLLPYFRALMLDDASRVVPFFQLITVFSILLSFLFLGEHLLSTQLIGVAIVVLGAFLLSMKNIEMGIFTPRASLWFMALSSLMYAITNVTFKAALDGAQGYWTTFGYQSIGVGIGALLMLCSRPLAGSLKGHVKKFTPVIWMLLLAITAIAVTAQLSLSYALTLAPVSLVATVGASQPFFVLSVGILLSIFAPRIFNEDMKRSTLLVKLISVLIMFFGIYLVYK